MNQLSGHLAPGARLGPHEIVRQLGAGSHGEVWLARHVLLDRLEAIKIIQNQAAEAAETNGARLMSRLDHPHIVTVYSADRVEGCLIVAMEYIEGRTLREALRSSGPLPIARALRIGGEIASALEYLHGLRTPGAASPAHLDVKPSNILLTERDQAKLTDFGIAGIADAAGGSSIGSPAYMAPEQFAGRAGPASDQWALALVIAEMIEGEPVLRAESVESYAGLASRTDLWLPDLLEKMPAGLRPILERCLRRDPAARFPDMASLRAALTASPADEEPRCPRCHNALSGDGICTECTVPRRVPPRRSGVSSDAKRFWMEARHGRFHWKAPLLLLLLVGAAIWGGWRGVSSMRPGVPAVNTSAPRETSAAAWRRVSAILEAPRGSHRQAIGALQQFMSSWPNASEAPQAAIQLRLWQRDLDGLEAAQAVERDPAAKISAHWRAWHEYSERAAFGVSLDLARANVLRWKKELDDYRGPALLTVRDAAGLPPVGLPVFGNSPPDPFFEILSDTRVLYRSRTIKKAPAPRWEESLRIEIDPSRRYVLEIDHERMIGSRMLVRGVLTPFPPDGDFDFKDAGVLVHLHLERER